MIILISFYQRFLSFDKGLLSILAPGGACRYPISCSEFAKQSIKDYGVLKGSWRGFKRFLSCNPFTEVKYQI